MGDAEKAEKERRRIKSTDAMRDLMTRYYIEAKTAGEKGRKVAWITSGGPVEPLYCFDVIPVYPENHGAMCGASHMAVELAEVAEERGFSRDVCSYARCDFGSAYTQGGPIGGLPRPDFLVCCNNICNTVVKWYEELARFFDVPLFIYDTPFVRGSISGLRHRLRDSPDEGVLRLPGARHRPGLRRGEVPGSGGEVARGHLPVEGGPLLRGDEPSPMTCFDAFILMAPVVTLRGTDEVITFYEGLLAEMRQRVEEGIAIIPGEKRRLLWDNIPIWYEMRNLGRLFMEEKTCLVADTYTNAWTFDRVDIERPLESLAEAYASVYLNIDLEQMLEQVVALAGRFKVDGMIMHSNRSCKPYSLGQYDLAKMFTKETGLPALIIEADHTDSRVYDRGGVETRIRHFLDLMLNLGSDPFSTFSTIKLFIPADYLKSGKGSDPKFTGVGGEGAQGGGEVVEDQGAGDGQLLLYLSVEAHHLQVVRRAVVEVEGAGFPGGPRRLQPASSGRPAPLPPPAVGPRS